MTDITNHTDFATVEEFFERLDTLPAHVVYGQLTHRPDWGVKMQERVPEHMRYGITVWVALPKWHLLGGFLKSLLSNDLMGAMGRADEVNLKALPDWGNFLHNNVPSRCFGSPEAVNEWKGLLEVEKKEN